MRTKILLLVTALTLGVGVIANASSTKEKEVDNLTKYLNKTIKYPGFAQDKGLEGSVSVIIWVDENQKLQYSNVQSNNIQLENYVEDWLKQIERRNIRFADNSGPKMIRIKFKLVS